MKIRYLGSAACEGWPAVFCCCDACRRARELGGENIRTRAQALIDTSLLVDLPPDTYSHVIRYGIDLSQIRTLLVTHSHQDHFYPAELVMRAEPYAHISAAQIMHVYGNHKVHMFYESALKQYNDSPNLAERICFHEISAFHGFETPDGFQVMPLLASHDKAEDCLIYLIEKHGQSILYGNDSGYFPQATWDCLRGRHINIVSLDCTCMLEREGVCHMGLDDDVDVRDRLLQEGCIDAETKMVVTHFSHNGKLTHAEISREASKRGFLAAYDGFEVGLG